MHVLFVADEQLIPTNDGGRLAAYNDIAALEASGCDVTVLISHRFPLDSTILAAHREAFRRVHFVQQRGVLASNLRHPLFPTVASMRIPAPRDFRRVSAELGNSAPIDLVIASHEYTLVVAKKLAQQANARVVLRSHNDESTYLGALARAAPSLKGRAFFGADAFRMASSLGRLLAGVDCVAVISPDDARSYEPYGLPTVYVPPILSVHIRAVEAIPAFASRLARIVFAGALDIPSASEGLVWFAQAVLPLIRERSSSIDLEVIGRGGSHTLVRTLSSLPGVVVTGEVPSLAPYMDRARVFVNPVFGGSGVSMKLGAPAAAGLPILSTHFGVRGLGALDGSVVACDVPAEMADAALRLLLDERDWLKHSHHLLDAIRSSYSTSSAAAAWGNLAADYRRPPPIQTPGPTAMLTPSHGSRER